MGHKKAWALVLGVITLVLAGFWAAPRVFPGLGLGLNELNQLSGIASLAVAVATLVVTLWPVRSADTLDAPGTADGNDNGGGGGDSIDMERVRAKGSVKAKSGPETVQGGGDRIRMRGIRAGKDVIGKQTTQSRRKPSR